MKDFLSIVLPEANNYFVMIDNKFHQHIECTSIDQVASAIVREEKRNHTVYFALAGYKQPYVWHKQHKKKQYRIHSNVQSVKSLWLDLDVDSSASIVDVNNPPKRKKIAYPSQADAIIALKQFCKDTHLPKPMVVNSGYGIHVYWSLNQTMSVDDWLKAASMLKKLCAHFDLKADPMRTTDPSSVLRPIGTSNRKGGDSKLVQLLTPLVEYTPKELFVPLRESFNSSGLRMVKHRYDDTRPSTVLDQAQTNLYVNSIPSYAPDIRNKCLQIGHIYATGGDVSEPLWYAGLQLIKFCVDGRNECHQMSSGYAGYSYDETEAKIDQLDAAQVKPTICATFDNRNPNVCQDCPHQGAIVSPISLGQKVREAVKPLATPIAAMPAIPQSEVIPLSPDSEIPNPPKPYMREESGRVMIVAEDDTQPELVYEYDLYPISRVYDASIKAEVCTFRTWLPKDGWRDFTFPTSTLYDSREGHKLLASVGILTTSPAHYMKVISYMVGYIKELQKRFSAKVDYAYMGWQTAKDNPDQSGFVLGEVIYKKGETSSAGISTTVREVTKAIASKGSLDEWKKIVNLYSQHDGTEPHIFGILAGFGAPLMEFTGYHGAIINLLGTTGTGKSTVLEIVNSIYGHPEKGMIRLQDTLNAIYKKMGVFHNLPLTFDEITNIEASKLSGFCYDITQGRARERMQADTTLRKNDESWHTLMISSSNSSLVHRLSIAKSNAVAESMRVFEYVVPQVKTIDRRLAQSVFPGLRDNYGLAGHVYINYLVNNQAYVMELLKVVTKTVEQKLGITNPERFWAAAISVTLTAGVIAKQLGLIEYDKHKLLKWISDTFNQMRNDLLDTVRTPAEVLIEYLDSHMAGAVIVDVSAAVENTIARNLQLVASHGKGVDAVVTNNQAELLVHPKAPICMRIETTKFRTFAKGYLQKSSFRKYCAEQGINATSVVSQLQTAGIISKSTATRALGKGTEYETGSVPVYVVNLQHKDLASSELVDTTENRPTELGNLLEQRAYG